MKEFPEGRLIIDISSDLPFKQINFMEASPPFFTFIVAVKNSEPGFEYCPKSLTFELILTVSFVFKIVKLSA